MTGAFFLPMLAKAYVLASLSGCPAAGFIPELDLKFEQAEVIYNTETPLNSLPRATLGAPLQANQIQVGSTASQVTNTYRSVLQLQAKSKNHCLYLKRLDVTIRYEAVIYIGAELKDDKCRFAVTKEHEEKHVAADLQALKPYLSKLESELKSYIRKNPAWSFPNEGEMSMQKYSDKIIQTITAEMAPVTATLNDDRRAAHAEIDSIKNIRRETSRCTRRLRR